jgi:hypothetical protein
LRRLQMLPRPSTWPSSGERRRARLPFGRRGSWTDGFHDGL